MNNCGRCGQHTPARLCDTCSTATIRALTLLAPIVSDLRSMMTDLRAAPLEERVDGTRASKLGADFDLSDRAHQLYATVANWVVGWSLAIPYTRRPSFLEQYGAESRVTGLPQGEPAYLAASSLANWLIGHHSRSYPRPVPYEARAGIDEHEEAGLYSIEVIDAITLEAHAIGYRPRPRRVTSRLCRVCDSAALRHDWPLGGEARLTCTACGEVHPCGPSLTRAVLSGR